MRAFGVIYVHINKANGKAYVGQTCQDLRRRFRKDDVSYNAYKSCTAFQNALKKYTWAGFDTTILVSCKSQEDLDFMEEYFINYYNSLLPNGYNSVGFAVGKVVYTQEVRDKIAKATADRMRGKPLMSHMVQRREHVFVDGVESKDCSICGKILPLSAYGAYKTVWDGLNRACKPCYVNTQREWRAAHPSKTLSEEELAAVRLAEKLRVYEKLANSDSNTTWQEAQAVGLKGVNVETGEELIFASTMDAKRAGFDRCSVKRAIKAKRVYKGYLWSFIHE